METLVAFGVSFMCVVSEGFRLKRTDVENRLTEGCLVLHINNYFNDHHVDGSITSVLEHDGKSDIELCRVMDCTRRVFEVDYEY